MKKMTCFTAAVFSATLLSGCAGINRNISNFIFPPFPSSDQRNGEKVTITLDEGKAEADCKASGTVSPMFFPAIAAGPAIDFAVKQIQEFLQEEAKRYTASYSATAVGDKFYDSGCPEAKINLNKITLSRNVAETKEAMKLELEVKKTLDETAFRIQPKSFTLNKSKAKIAAVDITRPFGFDILAPWTIFQINEPTDLLPIRDAKIDATIDISIYAVWVDKDGVGHGENIASKQIKVKNLKIGETKDISVSTDTQLFPAIPRSVKIDGQLYGLGNYAISMLVTEYDSFGERVTEINKTVESNKDGISKLFQ